MVLVIQPLGGLCNRMRVLDAAIAFAIQNNQRLLIIWSLNKDLNCGFKDLFLPINEKTIVFEIDDSIKYFANQLIKFSFRLSGKYYDNNYFEDFLGSELDGWLCGMYSQENELEKVTKGIFQGEKVAYAATCHRFYRSIKPFSDFKPTQAIQEKIDALTRNFESVVGVHIRRSDNQWSINHSPTSKFIELMKDEIDKQSDVKFFLATDCSSDQKKIQDLFSGRVITYQKTSLDRNSSSAIQDAMVDLYALSKTRKLIGSYASSFTKTASMIGGMETVIVGFPDSYQSH
ncbi:MAG: hypothetical protein ACKO24_08010 [Leptolyngbyaceae cyanobacterium]